jgi:hypothetical protein
MTNRKGDGQILVLFALVLILLMGISALVIDVGLKYSSERRYQAITDAASLAGAQEIQPPGRGVQPLSVMRPLWANARRVALLAVVKGLLPIGVVATCDTSADIPDCALPGGQYHVGIYAPSRICSLGGCDFNRSVEVIVREPAYQTMFARLFGQTTWALSRTSVAGLSWGRNYTIVALRPVKPKGGTTEVRNIRLDGGTQVHVIKGDVGTNSNMDYGSCASLLDLQTGYNLYYVDATPSWGCPNPPGVHSAAMIQDPQYIIPPAASDSAHVYFTLAKGEDVAGCPALATALLTNPQYAKYVPFVPLSAPGVPDATGPKRTIHCYMPGTYAPTLADGNKDLTILEPGLYYFNGGVDVQSGFIGGYDPSQPGVTLVFPRTMQFKQRSGATILNAGTKFRNPAGVEPATAPAMTNTVPSLKITVAVQSDPNCQVVLPYNTGCDDLSNDTINLAGGTALYLAGVQYAPSDNAVVTGNSSGDGYIGQVWVWTIYYKGNNTVINQEGLSPDGPGHIRIDTACSPGDLSPTCY